MIATFELLIVFLSFRLAAVSLANNYSRNMAAPMLRWTPYRGPLPIGGRIKEWCSPSVRLPIYICPSAQFRPIPVSLEWKRKLIETSDLEKIFKHFLQICSLCVCEEKAHSGCGWICKHAWERKESLKSTLRDRGTRSILFLARVTNSPIFGQKCQRSRNYTGPQHFRFGDALLLLTRSLQRRFDGGH